MPFYCVGQWRVHRTVSFWAGNYSLILETCPAQCNLDFSNMASMLAIYAFSKTSVLVKKLLHGCCGLCGSSAYRAGGVDRWPATLNHRGGWQGRWLWSLCPSSGVYCTTHIFVVCQMHCLLLPACCRLVVLGIGSNAAPLVGESFFKLNKRMVTYRVYPKVTKAWCSSRLSIVPEESVSKLKDRKQGTRWIKNERWYNWKFQNNQWNF